MADDASEEQLQQAAAIAAKTSDDGKVYGLVKRLKKAFTVKLNVYTLEMVREDQRELGEWEWRVKTVFNNIMSLSTTR